MYKLILRKGAKHKSSIIQDQDDRFDVSLLYKIMIIYSSSKMILCSISNMCTLTVVNEINVSDCFEFLEKLAVEKENREGNRNDLFQKWIQLKSVRDKLLTKLDHLDRTGVEL